MGGETFGLISVIMPAYNAEKTIEEAVASVCCQTYRSIELIVINDCSRDNTKQIVEKLSSKDCRIHLINNAKNKGVSLSRKEGVCAANGDWIAFLDSDDLWLPVKLEKQIALQLNTEAELLFTASGFIHEDGTPIDHVLHVPEKIGYKELLKQNLVSNSSVLIRRELYEKYCVVDDNIHEDYACWLNVLRSGKAAYGLDEPLLTYRVSSGSKSGNKLKAARMNWKTYKVIGLNGVQASYYMFWYAVKGILKYRNLRK